MNNVLLPAFAEIQLDLAAMRRGYLKTVGLAGFVAVVANTALLVNAHYFLTTFLGKGTENGYPQPPRSKFSVSTGSALDHRTNWELHHGSGANQHSLACHGSQREPSKYYCSL